MWMHIHKSMHAYMSHTWIYIGTCFDSNIVVECKTWSDCSRIMVSFIGSTASEKSQVDSSRSDLGILEGPTSLSP